MPFWILYDRGVEKAVGEHPGRRVEVRQLVRRRLRTSDPTEPPG